MSQTAQQGGNWKSGSGPVFNAPAVVLVSIGVLVAIHAGLMLGGEDWQVWALYLFSFIPARLAGEPYPMVAGSQVWSFITYAFLHADWTHLLFNCLWLLVFGTPAARFLGSAGFLVICAVASITGAIASLILYWGEQVIMVGASGAVSGLLATAIPIMYGLRGPLGTRPLFFGELLRSSKALGFMAIWLAITLFSGASGWTGNDFMGEASIAWEAHVGGFVGGLTAFYLIWNARMRRA